LLGCTSGGAEKLIVGHIRFRLMQSASVVNIVACKAVIRANSVIRVTRTSHTLSGGIKVTTGRQVVCFKGV
jgi:hypothetical protein